MPCPDSGIPPGTYRYEGGGGSVDVEVDADGCAAYEGTRAFTAHFTRALRDGNGTYDRQYRALSVCTVNGVVTVDDDGKLRAHHTRYDGDCLRGISDVIDERMSWHVTKTPAHPAIQIGLSDGERKTRVLLTRTPREVPSGEHALARKAETRSVQQDQMAVAFARDPNGSSPPARPPLSKPAKYEPEECAFDSRRFPPGPYSTYDDAPFAMRVRVTRDGCATYDIEDSKGAGVSSGVIEKRAGKLYLHPTDGDSDVVSIAVPLTVRYGKSPKLLVRHATTGKLIAVDFWEEAAEQDTKIRSFLMGGGDLVDPDRIQVVP